MRILPIALLVGHCQFLFDAFEFLLEARNGALKDKCLLILPSLCYAEQFQRLPNNTPTCPPGCQECPDLPD